uniref:Uncharacterized protein n=1 Tax=Acrobeloides nanus TaxID=290746 RepID=A0A914DNW4_9BILA
GIHLETVVDIVNADFTVEKLGGCARCRAGAELTYRCKADQDNVETHLTCDSMVVPVTCFIDNHLQVVNLAIDKTFINESCTFSYPGGSKSYKFMENFTSPKLIISTHTKKGNMDQFDVLDKISVCFTDGFGQLGTCHS